MAAEEWPCLSAGANDPDGATNAGPVAHPGAKQGVARKMQQQTGLGVERPVSSCFRRREVMPGKLKLCASTIICRHAKGVLGQRLQHGIELIHTRRAEMSAEENKMVVRRFFEEAWNQGNLALVDQLVASNSLNHDPANPGFDGAEGMKQLISTYRAAFPDIHFTIEALIAEGDQVVARWIGTGTHNGTLMGMSATGKRANVTGITINRLAGGKIEESWNNYDTLGMLQQLGVAPMPGQAIPMGPHVTEEQPHLQG